MSYPGENPRWYQGWPNIRALDARAGLPNNPYALSHDGRSVYGHRPYAEMPVSRKNDERTRQTRRRRSDEKVNEKDEEEEKKPRFVDYLVSTTGFQGPGKIWEAPYRSLKVLWFLAFLVACGIMIVQLQQLFEEFFSYPTKTVVKLKFNPLPLPALTFCNVNPIRLSFARNLSCELQDLLMIPDDLRSENCTGESFEILDLDFEDYFCDDCDDSYYYSDLEDLDDFAERRENIALYLGDEARETRRYVGHQLNDMIVNCSLFGRSCPFRNVTAFLSRDYGNCYTLSAPNIKATRSGPEAALVLTLNLELEEFIESYKTGYGLRVVLHEHGTRPFPSTEGFTISSGSETEMAIRMTQVKRKGGRYGNCDSGDVVAAISGYKYTIANCRDQCLQKTMVEKCKCVPLEDEVHGNLQPSTATPVRFCNTQQEYECTYKVWGKYINTSANSGGDICNCQTPCEEMVYTPTLSSRTWPVLSHIPVLEEQVCKLADYESPKCDYSDVDFSLENIDIRRGFTRLRLYYDRLNYEYVEELPFYDTERFLSDIGGTLGLWIGVTALGLVELFELALLAGSSCHRMIKSRLSRR